MSSARKSWHVLFANEPSAFETPPPNPPPPAAPEDEPQETGPLGPSSPIVKPSQSRSPSNSSEATNLPDSPKPRPSLFSTNELHGLREEEARGAEVTGPVVSVPPGNAVTGEKNKPKAEASVKKLAGPSPTSTTKLPGLPEDKARGATEVAGSLPLPQGSVPSDAAAAGEKEEKPKEASQSENYKKVSRLNTRYMKLRAAHGGAPPPGVDAEKPRKYELSDRIWGQSLPANKKEGREFEELRGIYPHLAVSVEQISTAKHGFLKRAFELIDDDKAGKLDAKLKMQRVVEVKTELKGGSVRGEVLQSLLKYVD